MAQRLSGQLELTWTNKDLRLLAHEDGGYEWVPPRDYRVAEVRLLHDAAVVGGVGPALARFKDNLLIRGDALSVLHSLVQLPELSDALVGKVRLAYLDPPFNTQQAFSHYDDALEHSVWLTMMRDRLAQIAELLADDGSIWVHCDDAEQAYLKVVMDELFGRTNFVATVVWQKRYSRENRKAIGFAHDYILVYAKCGPQEWAKRRNKMPRDAKTAKGHYRTRYAFAGKNQTSRLKRLGVAPQRLRGNAALLIDWFRVSSRHGWLGSWPTRNPHGPKPAKVPPKKLKHMAAVRRARGLDVPYGRRWERLKERMKKKRRKPHTGPLPGAAASTLSPAQPPPSAPSPAAPPPSGQADGPKIWIPPPDLGRG